jgi:hypothetical protein
MADILAPTNAQAPNTQAPVTLPSYLQPNAQNVYSAANITSAINAPMQTPDLSDPYGMRAEIQNSLGIGNVQNSVNALMQQVSDATKTAAAQNTFLGSQPVNLNVMTGQQAHAAAMNNDKINALTSDLNVQQSYLQALQAEADVRFQTALGERATLTQLINQYPGAKIKYSDSLTKAARKIKGYTNHESKKATIEQAYLQTFGTTRGKGQSLAEMQKALEKAGAIDRGLTLAQAAATLEKTQNDAATSGGGYTNTQLGKLRAAGIDPKDTAASDSYLFGSGGMTDSEIKVQNENTTYSALDMAKQARAQVEGEGWDGKLSPSDWKPLLKQWIDSGMPASDFFAKFKDYINPDDV